MILSRSRHHLLVVAVLVALLLGYLPTDQARAEELAPPYPHNVFVPTVFSSDATQAALRRQALEIAAEQSGIAVTDLEIVAAANSTYPYSGQESVDFKISNVTGDVTLLITLLPTGEVADSEELLAADYSIYEARYGKLDPALVEAMVQDPAQTHQVMIWLHEPEMAQAAALAEVFDTTTPLDENPEAVDAYLAELDTQRANVVATLVEPMTTKLMDLGLTDVLSAELSPVLFVTLDPSHVQTIAHWPEVAEISLLPVLADPEDETDLVLYPETEADALLSAPEALSDPNLNIADDAIWVHIARQRGYTGRGILIGQVEIDGRVDTAHASLRSGISQDTTYTCSSPGTHSTGVAGMMRSNHSTHTGIAVGATLRAAGSCASRYNVGGELFNRTDATIRWGAMSVNHSYGETLYSSSRRKYPTSFDKFYDQKVYFSRRVMVIAGGNECGTYSSRTCLVSSPAMGYNVLTVGAFDDRNTATWYDDRMSSFSSYVDPLSTNGDRNKPEIVAPGTNIYGPYPRGYWKDWSGTSFSAPIVTGVTALMAQANSNLKSYPEAVKAILMATAGHNIEGNSANSTSDGAGAINALWAVEISRGTNGGWGRYSWTCSTSSRTVQTMSLIRGKRTRVALVWAQPPTYGSYSYRPSADLDLRVRDSAGRTVASSSSYDNTYEVVEFTPTTTGNYSIYVANFRCSQAPNYLAWAWWRNP